MNAILSAVLPVALIISIGYFAGRTLNLEELTLSQLSVYILAPALVADSLYRTTVSGQSIGKILIAYALISLILYIVVFLITKLFKISINERQSWLAIVLCPNNGNMGLPVVTFALGDQGLERAIIYMIGSSILLFGILPAMLKGEGIKEAIRLTWKLPLIWAMLLGIVLNLFQIELPFNLGKSLEWLGIAAIPIALIILGMQLASSKFQLGWQEIGGAMAKLAIAPLVAVGVGKTINLETIDLQVLILQTGMPTAVNSLIMVKEFGGNPLLVARTIILSTIMSFISLPIIIWLITK